MLEAGGAHLALHVRAPGVHGREVFEWCRELRPVAEQSGATLLVNDRVDVARALGLGVHLGQRSLQLSDARNVLGSGGPVGVSCHGADEADAAAKAGADYLVLGNIFETPSHPDRSGVGLSEVGEVVRRVPGVPIVAIGGVTVANTGSVIDAGAWGVAVLRGIWGASDSATAAVEYISALGKVEEGR